MRLLLLLLFLVVIVKLNDIIIGTLRETFDNNCITNITPKIHVGISDFFERDENGNIMIDSNGNAIYSDPEMSADQWNKTIETRVQNAIIDDMDALLKNPYDKNYPFYYDSLCTSNDYLS